MSLCNEICISIKIMNFVKFLSGHTWDELWPCIQWMRCFAEVTRQKGVLRLSSFDQVACEDAHNIQTHAVDLNLLVSCNNKQVVKRFSQFQRWLHWLHEYLLGRGEKFRSLEQWRILLAHNVKKLTIHCITDTQIIIQIDTNFTHAHNS